ncbi:hypothetical protein I302_101703 [Kwoniella bestiolae CBS 10118]|uniref:Uncharacterized protein n=1 Tax=Kwoniella bestiolae CBS 10118 TaxID=1296100 RepID=A0A1B9GCY4_9TREE|nr:hypothetical protein I302_00379 [Kwoniella bestiolae CBS 10118]OCF28889.1 hypothetical protein I302_00379 [Kwoniella bestiolae CBS 10118]
MLFTHLLVLLPLIISSSASPLLSKRDESIVKISTSSNTRISHVKDLKNVALDGGFSAFDFTRNSPSNSQDSAPSGKQEFYWDVFEEGSRFGKQLYHLTCYVEVNMNFRGTAIFGLNTGSPHVTLTSGMMDAKTDIGIICPKADAKRVLPEGAKGCDNIPGWDGKGPYSWTAHESR